MSDFGSDAEDFDFCERYGNDLLNHIARVLVDREQYEPQTIKAAVADLATSVGNYGDLWEEVSGPAVDLLERVVDRYIEKIENEEQFS